MAAIFECKECGYQAVFEREEGLNQCPKCDDIHVDVTYGVPSYVSYLGAMAVRGGNSRQERMDELGITEQDIAETMPPKPEDAR